MGRTLPWKPDGRPSATKPPTCLHPTRTASPPPGSSPSRPKPAAPSARSTLVSGPVPPQPHMRRPKESRTDDSAGSPPSTPPQSSEGPLPESFMVEGFDNDDRWRMVEDEFYSVAARFTAHLHAAQYRRLKDEAKRLSPNTIRTLARPVTRPPTVDVMRRQAASTLAVSQRRAITTARLHAKASNPAAAAAVAAQSEDEDNDRFQIQLSRKRTHLASLMNSPRKKAQPLTSIASIGKARATALSTYSQASSLGTGTSRAREESPAKHRQTPASAKTAHASDELRGIPQQASSRNCLTSQRASSQVDFDYDADNLEQHSARTFGARLGTQKPATTTDSQSRAPAAPKPVPAEHASLTPALPPFEGDCDSDSGLETYFQRRLRERRKKPHRRRSPAADEPAGQGENQAKLASKDAQNAALTVPSI